MEEPLRWYEDPDYLVKQSDLAHADMAYHLERLEDARERDARVTLALVSLLRKKDVQQPDDDMDDGSTGEEESIEPATFTDER
jgi:hypothetical protein